MAEEIRGLTIRFDSDFSEFRKGMTNADKDISSFQKQLKNLSDSLKIEFDETKFTQAQKLAQQALEGTEQKANLLRQRLQQMEEAGVTDKTRNEYNYLQEQLTKTETNAQKLQQQLEQLNNLKLNNLVDNINRVGQGITSVGTALTPISAAAGAAAVGLAKMSTEAFTAVADIDDLAQRAGVSAQKIQELQYVSTMTGVATNTLSRALIRARAAYADMGTGNVNAQVEALEALGISYGQFENQEDIFDGIIERLSAMEDDTLKVAYANEIFGDRIANELLPLLNAGSDELQRFKDEFAGFDTLSDEQVAAMANMDDVLFRVKETFKNLGYQIANSLIPLFTYFADIVEQRIVPKVREVVEWFQSLSLEQQRMIVIILAVITALAPLLILIGKITSGISGLIKIVSVLGKAASASLGWLTLIIALLAVAYASNEQFRETLNNLVSTLLSAVSPALNALGQILSLIAPLLEMIGNVVALLLVPALKILTPLIEIVGQAFQWLYSILEPVLDVINRIADGISYIFGGKKTADYEVNVSENGKFTPSSDVFSTEFPEYTLPTIPDTGSSGTIDNTYYDNSNVTINIEKNDYMTEDDIIKAVNRGLKQAKQART